MRNQRLLLIVLILFLLAGGVTVGYFLIPSDPPARNSTGRADNEPAANAPRPDNPARANDAPVTRPDNRASDRPDDSEVRRTPAGNEPGPGPGPVVKPEPGPEPAPDMSKWVERSTEHTIKGRIVYKSDGRPAAGAAITAEANRNEWGRDEHSGMPRPAAPESRIEGSTFSDGMGEFVLKIKVTRRVPPPDEKDAGGDRAVRPDEGWTRWGGSEYVVVVGRMAGYAPARSGALYVGEFSQDDLAVNLSLAIPAALSGRVIDAVSRAGIAGANVQIFQSDAGTDGWTAPRNTTTDKDGYFSVMDLGAGVYTVSASADGYSPDTPWRNGRRVDLSKGGETSVGDIPLLPAATVVGRVVDAETGQGIKGAAIELETTSQFMRFAQHSGRSGEDGSFILPGVAAGQYTLKTQAEGYAPVFRPNFITESGQRVDAGTIRLGRGFAVSGTVVDAEGKPVAGATVMLSERGAATGFGWEPPGTQLGTAQTASNGSFTIGGLIECEARAVVSASGFASARHDVKLAAGMAPLVLRIHRGVSITGRVLLPDGAPAAGALVGVVSHDDPAYNIHKMQPGQMRWFGERGVQATAVSDGTFLLSNVPPGTYLLMAFAGTGRGVSVDDLKVETGDLNVGDLRLPAPGTLRVTVTEAGQPVANLRVEARAGMGGWTSGSGGEVVPSAETDASGVALIADVPAGEAYVMTARDKEGAEAELFTRRRVNIKPGQTTEFRIELRSADAARIHGRVTLNGRPQFSEVMLLGTGDKASSFKQARLDEAGFFEMVNVVNGNYVLHFRVADKTMSSMVTVAVDKPGDLDVSRDFAGFGVAGKVTTPSNSPSERASVRVSLTRLNDPSPEQFAQWLRAETQCGADGLFRFDHVPAGNYRVTAALAGVGSVSQDVAVSSGDLSGLALELVNNSGRLRVTIKQIVGKPVAQQNFGLAQLRDAAGAIVDLESENAGFFVGLAGTVIDLPTIPAGTYTLVMSSAGCLTLEKAGVVISKGEQTAIEVDLTAAAELHLTVTNSEITQEQLDNAKVRYFDAQGAEITRHTNPFDAWSGAGAPEKPTLVARYIGPGVAKVRVKVQGFAEIELPVEFEPGKKIERNETLVAG